MSDPIQLLHLYVFCAKLERDLQGTLAVELKTWKCPSATEFESNKWRSPDHRKRQRTETAESSNVNKRARGASNTGPVDEGDQYMDILKWRDEVGDSTPIPNTPTHPPNATHTI